MEVKWLADFRDAQARIVNQTTELGFIAHGLRDAHVHPDLALRLELIIANLDDAVEKAGKAVSQSITEQMEAQWADAGKTLSVLLGQCEGGADGQTDDS